MLSKKKTKKKIVKKRVLKTNTKKTDAKKKKKPLRRVGRVVKRRKKSQVKKKPRSLSLKKSLKNPIMGPSHRSYWESEAVFNPGAVMHNGRVHLFYRALGPDGVSRIGYASSKDGIHFDRRHAHPVFLPELHIKLDKHSPHTSPARPVYDRALYPSGGGWGGCEDPRAVKIDDRVYMTFNLFNGWDSIRIGLTSIGEDDLEAGRWNWRPLNFLSPVKERHKNWVLFPEKIDGKFAIFHNLHGDNPNEVRVEFIEDVEAPIKKFVSPDPQSMGSRVIAWHNRTRSIGPPPVKTKYGWLTFYHAMDKDDPGRYKLGAMILDSNNPTKVLYRSNYPILEPDEWYENDWKPGIIYASGSVIKGETLYIYYGGGDKHIGVAYTNINEFTKKLMRNEHAVLTKKKIAVA